MYQAGRYYLEKQGRSTGIPVKDILNMAIYSMGLNDVSSFNPAEKILGLPPTDRGPLVSLTTANLVNEVSRETPAPGGGSGSGSPGRSCAGRSYPGSPAGATPELLPKRSRLPGGLSPAAGSNRGPRQGLGNGRPHGL